MNRRPMNAHYRIETTRHVQGEVIALAVHDEVVSSTFEDGWTWLTILRYTGNDRPGRQ